MVQRFILRLCDYIFVTRPLILTPAWSFFLLGAREGLRAGGAGRAEPLLPPLDPILSMTFILASAYLINQIFDRATDRVNKKVFFLSQGLFGARRMVLMALCYFLAASYFFHRVGEEQKAVLVGALVLSLLYSLPPLRLCARPFLDLLANGIGFGGLAFVLGYSSLAHAALPGAYLSIPYVTMVSGVFVYTAILDMEGDKKTGKRSTAVILGEGKAMLLAVAFILVSPAAALATGNYYAVPITLVVAALGLFTCFKRSRRRISFLVQASTLTVILGACALWPLYFLVVLPLVWVARYYHRRRFGIIYPGVSRGS